MWKICEKCRRFGWAHMHHYDGSKERVYSAEEVYNDEEWKVIHGERI